MPSLLPSHTAAVDSIAVHVRLLIALVVAGWSSCGLLARVHAAENAAEQRVPNFVLILADDVSPDDLAPYSTNAAKTPHLARLAQEGLRFDRVFLTCSSCSPSRCSLITGRYPHQTGAAELHQPLPAQQVTFTELLKSAGYYVAAAGKWHLGNEVKDRFDHIVEGQPSGCEHWVETLANRPADKPFFLWLAALDAHRDYDPQTIEQRHASADVQVPAFLPDVPEARRDLANYYDEISRLDDYVGKVLAELDRQGVADNTIVLFMADNGRAFPRCKTTVYDSGIRTPCILRWPGKIKAGEHSASLISSIDVAPTFLELAGIKVPDSFVGRSFVGVLNDPESPHRDAVFAEHNWHDYAAHQRAVRTERYLYIRNDQPQHPATPPADAVRSPTYRAMQKLFAERQLSAEQQGCFVSPMPREELYDLARDPDSLKNLASDPQHQSVLAALRDRLAAWSRETNDELPTQFTPDKFDRETGERLP